jgi:hypothetical protein
MIDKLAEDEKKKKAARKKDPFDGDDDDVETTMEKPLFGYLNTKKSVFDEGGDDRFGGINSAKSVFDKQAVFHVGRGD